MRRYVQLCSSTLFKQPHPDILHHYPETSPYDFAPVVVATPIGLFQTNPRPGPRLALAPFGLNELLDLLPEYSANV